MSIKRCCVPKCMEDKGQPRILHPFPNPETEIERFRQWVHLIGGDILALNNEDIFKYRRVCHAHFEKKYCCRNDRISNIAVPTLHMADNLFLPKLKKPLMEIQNVPSTSKGNLLVAKPRTSIKNIENFDYILVDEPGSVSLPKFTYSRMKPVKETQNVPLTSKGNVATMEVDTPIQNLENIDTTMMDKLYSSAKRKKPKRMNPLKMTKNEKEIYEKLVETRIKLSKFRAKVKKQSSEIKLANKFMTNPKFEKLMNSLPIAARTLTLLQFREHKKKDKGRRFSLKEKILALALLKQSPKAYRFMRKNFILPSPQVLTKLLHQADIQPGINKTLFGQLTERTKNMKPEEKLCVLLFDEMSLMAHMSYNERRDSVIGFVNNGQKKATDIADHAQVFMVRGLVHNYRPVAYTFAQAATKGPELATQIKCLLKSLLEAGLEVCATVCDQGSNNRHAIRLLCEETRGEMLRNNQDIEREENIIIINNKKIIPLYDPPHLLKGIRNNLITKNLKCTIDKQEKIAKWNHILLLHTENNIYRGIRLINKLTDTHVIPEKIPKMKVKY